MDRKAALLTAPIARKLIGMPPPAKETHHKMRIMVFRINPMERLIARIAVDMTTEPKSGAATIARLCRTNNLGSQQLDCEVAGYPLVAAGDAGSLEGTPAWRLRDQGLVDNTMGMSVLFALGPTGGMASLPAEADMTWAQANIVWVEGEK